MEDPPRDGADIPGQGLHLPYHPGTMIVYHRQPEFGALRVGWDRQACGQFQTSIHGKGLPVLAG